MVVRKFETIGSYSMGNLRKYVCFSPEVLFLINTYTYTYMYKYIIILKMKA